MNLNIFPPHCSESHDHFDMFEIFDWTIHDIICSFNDFFAAAKTSKTLDKHSLVLYVLVFNLFTFYSSLFFLFVFKKCKRLSIYQKRIYIYTVYLNELERGIN